MITHIARREWLEQRRHPAMLGICAFLLVLISVLVFSVLGMLDLVHGDPEALKAIEAFAPGTPPADTLSTATQVTLSTFGFLIYSQYLGFVGVIAGHSLLHDRALGTLPFLLLAPVSRGSLLAGKVLGAIGPLTVVFWTVGALAGLAVSMLQVSALHPSISPSHASWWVALFAAGPAWAAFVATACAVVSSVATDVRLAQQGVWFVVFFVQLLVAFLITGALGSVSAQLLAVALGVGMTSVAWMLGARVISRDLSR